MRRTACPPTTGFKQYRTHPLWVTRLSAALCPYMGTRLPIWIIWQEQPPKRKPPAFLSSPFVECLNLTMRSCDPHSPVWTVSICLWRGIFPSPQVQLGSHWIYFGVSPSQWHHSLSGSGKKGVSCLSYKMDKKNVCWVINDMTPRLKHCKMQHLKRASFRILRGTWVGCCWKSLAEGSPEPEHKPPTLHISIKKKNKLLLLVENNYYNQ